MDEIQPRAREEKQHKPLNRKQRRQQERRNRKLMNNNNQKPSLQKIEGKQVQNIQTPQPQRPPTPEEVVDFSVRKLQEIGTQIQQQQQNFVQHYFNIYINAASSLLHAAVDNSRLVDYVEILKVAEDFTLQILEHNPEFEKTFVEKFQIPETLQNIVQHLNGQKQRAENEIIERDIVRQNAEKEFQEIKDVQKGKEEVEKMEEIKGKEIRERKEVKGKRIEEQEEKKEDVAYIEDKLVS